LFSDEESRVGRLFFKVRRPTMRHTSVALALVAALSVCAELSAQAPGGGLGERIQDLQLTPEQESKIADIRRECRPKIQQEVKQLTDIVKDEVEKVRGILTSEQKQKVEALKEERREQRHEGLAARLAHLNELDLTEAELTKIADIRKEFHPKVEQAMKQLADVLTAEQKQAREAAQKAGKNRREVLASLNLTDAQKAKVETIGTQVRTLVRQELEQMSAVLTAEQKEELAVLKDERRDRVRDRMAARIANLRDLGLTEDQKSSMAAIRTEFRPRVHEAGNKLRSTVREELGMILEVIKD